MENSESGFPSIDKPFIKFLDFFKKEEKKVSLKIELTSEVATKLHQLSLRPNPNLAEFPFIALGNASVVEEILTANESGYSPDSRLSQNGESFISSIDKNETESIFNRLHESGKKSDLIIDCHLHPSGEGTIQDKKYLIKPDDSLLYPSVGHMGDLVNGGDLGYYKSFVELNPSFPLKYIGIVANTQDGPKLRIYDLQQLLKIKKISDIDKVSQQTIKL